MIWPHIAARVRIGEPIFSDFSSLAFNRAWVEHIADAGFAYAGQFRSHCFRRGATQELLNAGPPTGTIKSAGCWAAKGFRSYIDTQMTDALKIARLAASAVNSDSEDDTGAPVNVEFGLPLTKRREVFPSCGIEWR